MFCLCCVSCMMCVYTPALTLMSCRYILTRLTLSDSGSSSMRVMLVNSVRMDRMLSLWLTT